MKKKGRVAVVVLGDIGRHHLAGNLRQIDGASSIISPLLLPLPHRRLFHGCRLRSPVIGVEYMMERALPAASALVAMVLVMLTNTSLARSQEKLHSKIIEAKDSRIKALAETLKCMRILKLHSWELAYLDKMITLRSKERRWLKRYLTVVFLFWASPILVSVVTFGVCITVKAPLLPGVV